MPEQFVWWKHGVVYQVYVRSFADSNGDGVGDLEGVRQRLDHLEWLGVDAVWLSPIFPSAMRDFGYDVTDYHDVDPVFGDLCVFDSLIEAAHSRGIRVLLDWVPNHTSTDHPWFVESAGSRSNGKRDWYVWADGHGYCPPNNWQSAFPAVGPAWRYDGRTGQWYLHSFLPEQADLNWENAEVEAAQHDIMRFWLDRGVDGFRIDVVHNLGKDPQLLDNPTGIVRPSPATAGVRRDEDYWPSLWPKIEGIRAVLDTYDDRVAVGETYVLDPRRLAEYTRAGRLHLGHDFALTEVGWSANDLAAAISSSTRALGPSGWPAWVLASHDHGRVASRWGANEHRAEAAYALLYLMRGAPFLYQGEELGLADACVPAANQVDVDGRDRVRTPMPWSADEGAGFTTGDPWLPVADDARRRNVAEQRADRSSTLWFHRDLIALRRRHPALHAGEQRVEVSGGLLAIHRTHPAGDVTVWINTGADAAEVAPPAGAAPLLVRRADVDPELIRLEPNGVVVIG